MFISVSYTNYLSYLDDFSDCNLDISSPIFIYNFYSDYKNLLN